MWNSKKRWPNGGAVQAHADDLRQWAAEGVSQSEMARRIHANRRHIRQFFATEGIVPLRLPQTLANNPKWRGGRIRDKHGYMLVYMPDHPSRNSLGYVREHRLVMERLLGRYLHSEEVVDHRDGDPGNNDLSNLRLFASNAEHLRATLTGKSRQGSSSQHRSSQSP